MMTTNSPLVFLGTPDFAARVLQGLLASGLSVIAVISMPDRPSGRGYQLSPTPVKQVAMTFNIPCYQPENADQLDVVLRQMPHFLGLVVAYGMILPDNMVRRYMFVNLHASILPKYRGASPIQAALLNGDAETGISLMRIDKDVDAGEVFAVRPVVIEHRDQSASLIETLIRAAISLFVEYYVQHPLPWKGAIQDHGDATYTKKIKREDGLVDLVSESAEMIYRKWQAYTPWPGVFVYHQGKRVKLIDLDYVGGVLVFLRVQVEGKSAIDYGEFLRGNAPLLL